MATFVLVPGGWFGAWSFQAVADGLRRRGHRAYPAELTGVGERAHLYTVSTNLDTHIADVVSLIESESLSDIVLCGHSYGGMVVSGVADRVVERIGHLVYLDAYVPSDGESCGDLTTDAFRRLILENSRADGYRVMPPARADERATAHPLASFMQQIRLTGSLDRVPGRDFVYLNGWSGSPFPSVYERLREDPSWLTHVLSAGHNVMLDSPELLLEILCEIDPGSSAALPTPTGETAERNGPSDEPVAREMSTPFDLSRRTAGSAGALSERNP